MNIYGAFSRIRSPELAEGVAELRHALAPPVAEWAALQQCTDSGIEAPDGVRSGRVPAPIIQALSNVAGEGRISLSRE